jgi:hypothetical protein
MFHAFTPYHIPPLFGATALTFGGLWPIFNGEASLLEFGLPKRVAISKSAQNVQILSSGRGTAIGLAIYAFYFQDKFEEVDTILLSLLYVGLIDGYVCWKEGVAGRGLFRFASGAFFAAWGWFGLTTR